MSGLSRSLLVSVVALASACGCGVPSAAAARGHSFLAGAAVLRTTPPLAGSPGAAVADAKFGAPRSSCPSAAYPTEGRFALQEPFNDVNGNRQWDEGVSAGGAGGSGSPPEPFCDPNANSRWDGLYADNGKGPVTGVHDQLEVRAFTVSDGRDRPVVYASVDQIGLFDYYTEQARLRLSHVYHVNASLVVSADHNESSPDSIGLYGPMQTPLGVGLQSGIDEYFMRFLEDRIARAAALAVHRMRRANLYAIQVQGPLSQDKTGGNYTLLHGLSQRISDQFPTSVALPRDDRVAAVDPKMGVLQARTPTGRPVFTAMSVAAHNQEMGNSGRGLSADWPGAFARVFDARHFGVAVFLVGDNGSEEDPQTNPPVIPNGSENHSSQAVQWRQAQATGARFAALTAEAARGSTRLHYGRVKLVRRQVCIPLQNNGFVALAATGEFGQRQGYVCDSKGVPQHPVPFGGSGGSATQQFRTFLGYADIGPDLQLIDIPGEAFPALMLGSPFGSQDESCHGANPAVPTWHARAAYRFQVGLADDLLGYLIPPWGFASGAPGLFTSSVCVNDMHGHRHKLESESVGPAGALDVARGLSKMLAAEADPTARIARGRFVRADGTLSRWPTGAVGALVDRGAGVAPLLLGAPRTAGIGARAVDRSAVFMDYDGQPQARPDVTTRGMLVLGPNGCVLARHYLNVFPNYSPAAWTPGHVRLERAVLPARACASGPPGSAALQPLAAAGAGLPVSAAAARLVRAVGAFAVRHPRAACRGRLKGPGLRRVRLSRGVVSGTALAGTCAGRRAPVARVVVLSGRSGALLARGTGRFRLRLKRRPKGGLRVVAIDTDGLSSRRSVIAR